MQQSRFIFILSVPDPDDLKSSLSVMEDQSLPVYHIEPVALLQASVEPAGNQLNHMHCSHLLTLKAQSIFYINHGLRTSDSDNCRRQILSVNLCYGSTAVVR